MKIFIPAFLLLLSVSLFTYAQSFQLFDPATSTYVTNTTITVHGTVTEDEIAAVLHVKNNSATDKAVKVRRTNQSVVSGTANSLCWGTCFAPSVNLSPNPITIAAGTTNTVDFACHFNPNTLVGVSSVLYTFFDNANTTDSVWVIIQYDITATNVPTLAANTNYISSPYPSPANSFVCFNFCTKGNSKGFITIHNMLGEVVKRIEVLNAGNIKINTLDLIQGAYIVSFEVDQKVVKTSRFLVTH